jgi:hypothetical protein
MVIVSMVYCEIVSKLFNFYFFELEVSIIIFSLSVAVA